MSHITRKQIMRLVEMFWDKGMVLRRVSQGVPKIARRRESRRAAEE